MAIYYFHVRDHLGLVEDEDGVELADFASLLTEVMRSSNELSDDLPSNREIRFEIADADGRTVLVSPVHGSGMYWELLAGARTRRSIQ